MNRSSDKKATETQRHRERKEKRPDRSGKRKREVWKRPKKVGPKQLLSECLALF
jgi:hypothetical protein